MTNWRKILFGSAIAGVLLGMIFLPMLEGMLLDLVIIGALIYADKDAGDAARKMTILDLPLSKI